jgi:hypothetical protein
MFIAKDLFIDDDIYPNADYYDYFEDFSKNEGTIKDLVERVAFYLNIKVDDIEVGYEGSELTLTGLGIVMAFSKVGGYEDITDED